MQIQIHIPRPGLTLAISVAAVLWMNGTIGFSGSQAGAQGGIPRGTVITQSRSDIDRERLKQAMLGRREEILRFELQLLEEEALKLTNPEKMKSLADHREILLKIIEERGQSEKLLSASLEQLWEAQGTDFLSNAPAGLISLDWPVEPVWGISAEFEDPGYEARFGMPHHAIDIPVEQGTVVRAPAEGTVARVALNGLGYSYVVLAHRGGFETVYGHISGSLVQEGDTVFKGDPIALSGGRPGSIGAGLLTTGPHLHFAVKKDGKLVDPQAYLEVES